MKDEYLLLQEQGLARNIDDFSGIKQIKPQSEKMKELFVYQQEYYTNKQAKPKRN